MKAYVLLYQLWDYVEVIGVALTEDKANDIRCERLMDCSGDDADRANYSIVETDLWPDDAPTVSGENCK